MTAGRIAIGLEIGKTRSFGWVLDWPGWCRGAKDRLDVPAALAVAAPRYARVAGLAGLEFIARPDSLVAGELELLDTVAGSASTDYGVPGSVAPEDHRPVTASDADRIARIVAAAWALLDEVVAGAPAELRKGPRGGGRDRDNVVAHCVSSDSAYAALIGLKMNGLRMKGPDPLDRPAVEAERAAILAILRQASDGSPLAGRRWPARYAARRIAWHALDHAWEIEDRT